MIRVVRVPVMALWMGAAYLEGVVEGRRRTVLVGVAGFLCGLGLGLLSGGGL